VTRVRNEAALLRQVVREQDVRSLVRALFGYKLTPGQVAIVRSIVFGRHKRIIINAHTRYGKSRCIAIAICLIILLDRRPLKIRLIGPTDTQASILKTYMAELISKCPPLQALLDQPTGQRSEKLDKEQSKRRWTFSDGKDLMVLSAQGRADRLMGWGGDIVVVDESALMTASTYHAKISRMLGDSPDSILIESSNPWHRGNHYYQHWTSPRFHKIHIGYEQGLREGRITQEFLDEQRNGGMTQHDFTVLYRSEFPDASEHQLITHAWIDAAADPDNELDVGPRARERFGLDVAEGGRDLTVLSRGLIGTAYGKDLIDIQDPPEEVDEADSTRVAEWAARRMPNGAEVVVDSVGPGKAVGDMLRAGVDVDGVRKRFRVLVFKGGNTPATEKSKARDERQFVNMNAEGYWKLREALREGRMRIPPEALTLRRQLAQPEWDTETGRTRVDKKPNGAKSPDHADSVMMLVHGGEARRVLSSG
jgi:hypothetical protein